MCFDVFIAADREMSMQSCAKCMLQFAGKRWQVQSISFEQLKQKMLSEADDAIRQLARFTLPTHIIILRIIGTVIIIVNTSNSTIVTIIANIVIIVTVVLVIDCYCYVYEYNHKRNSGRDRRG